MENNKKEDFKFSGIPLTEEERKNIKSRNLRFSIQQKSISNLNPTEREIELKRLRGLRQLDSKKNNVFVMSYEDNTRLERLEETEQKDFNRTQAIKDLRSTILSARRHTPSIHTKPVFDDAKLAELDRSLQKYIDRVISIPTIRINDQGDQEEEMCLDVCCGGGDGGDCDMDTPPICITSGTLSQQYTLEFNLNDYTLLCGTILSTTEWKKLDAKNDMGCGLNSLVFLGIITRELGNDLLQKIEPSGTSFFEIMSAIYNSTQESRFISYIEYKFINDSSFDISISIRLNLLKIFNLLPLPPTNEQISVTIIKYNRASGPGHTVIFFKDINNRSGIFDALTGTLRYINDATNFLKITEFFKSQGFISFSIIFKQLSSTVTSVGSTTQNAVVTAIQELPKSVTIKPVLLGLIATNIMIFKLDFEKIANWRPSESTVGCTVEVYGILNILNAREYEDAIKYASQGERGTFDWVVPQKIAGQMSKYRISFDFDNINELLPLLDINSAIIIFLYSRGNSIHGHSVIICCILNDQNEKTLYLIDPQMTSPELMRQIGSSPNHHILVTANIDNYLSTLNFNRVFDIFTVGEGASASVPVAAVYDKNDHPLKIGDIVAMNDRRQFKIDNINNNMCTLSVINAAGGGPVPIYMANSSELTFVSSSNSGGNKKSKRISKKRISKKRISKKRISKKTNKKSKKRISKKIKKRYTLKIK